MIPTIIAKRLEALKRLFPDANIGVTNEGEPSAGEGKDGMMKVCLGVIDEKPVYAVFFASPKEREIGLLHLLSDTWRREIAPAGRKKTEEWLEEWMIASLHQVKPLPLPLPLETGIDWKSGWIPLLLWMKKEARYSLNELKALYLSYTTKESILLKLSQTKLLALLPQERVRQEEGEKNEWIMGLHDLLQNELGDTVTLLYNDGAKSPEALLQKTREMLEMEKIIQPRWDPNRPLAPWDLIGEAFIASMSKEAKEKIEALYAKKGNLSILQEHEWEQILLVYFRSHLNLSQAAKALYMHRNTLNYRLDRIYSETGFDPRNFDEAFLLRLYLLLHPHRES